MDLKWKTGKYFIENHAFNIDINLFIIVELNLKLQITSIIYHINGFKATNRLPTNI